MSIPTINLSNATSPALRSILLHELRHVLLNVGFLYLSHHSISESTIQNLLDVLPVLFSLPECPKNAVGLINSPHFLGYSRFGDETTAGKRDQREQFEFANELPNGYDEAEVREGGEVPLWMRLQGPNQWPEFSSVASVKKSGGHMTVKFREVVEVYIAALQDLAERFLGLVEEALEVEKGSLSRFTGPQDRVKLVHYRSEASLSSPDGRNGTSASSNSDAASPSSWVQGVGPHKDSSGWMTFLLQTQPSASPSSSTSINGKGLQVLTKSGTWLDVPPIPGTFVVNLGQAFEAVTNGLCKATTHRVLLPLSPSGYDRYSVPFFQGVRPELRKEEFRSLWEDFEARRERWAEGQGEDWVGKESEEGQRVDSPFLQGDYETWGEAQLRTKIRSHRDVGRRWYGHVFHKYVNHDG